MESKIIINDIFYTIRHLLATDILSTTYRVGNAFTRKRKLGFSNLFLFLLRQYEKSLPINILDFLEEFPQCGISSISKQAISKARKGIHSQAFAELLKISQSAFYQHSKRQSTWNGFHIFAIDGTSLQMPQTKENLETFGSTSNQSGGRFAMAHASLLYDTLNDIIIDAQLHTCKYDERDAAIEHLKTSSDLPLPKNHIFVLDRGYPCIKLCREFQDPKRLFVMRVKNNTASISKMEQRDGLVTYGSNRKKEERLCLRALRIPLNSSEEEYLLTNIFDTSITWEMFRELYFLRWPIETKYWELKHRFQIENFTGHHPCSIHQDFYITLFLSNLASIIKRDTDRIIAEKTKDSKKEFYYQTNRGMVINRVKKYILRLLSSTRKKEKLWEQLFDACIKTRSQVRPNRTYERKAKHTRRRHHHNRKLC